MTPDKIDRAFISMFSKFIVCVNMLIVNACAMYMLTSYDEFANELTNSSCDWLVVCHDGWDSIIK
jgi:hypothetical protein